MKAGLLWIASLALGAWTVTAFLSPESSKLEIALAGSGLLIWGLFATYTFIFIRDKGLYR